MSYTGLRKHLLIAAAGTALFFAVAHSAQGTPRRHVKHHSTQFVPAGKPHGCPAAWCGCWLMHRFGLTDKRLWQARQWARLFQRTAAQVGAVVVWPHHVGVIVGGAPGQWVILSGNDGHRVRERVRSVRGAIAFVQPNSQWAGM